MRCPALQAPMNNTIILKKTGISLGSTPGEFLTFCPPHTRTSETRHAKISKSDLSANRAARIIRLHLANDVYQSLGNSFSTANTHEIISVCTPARTYEKVSEASRKSQSLVTGQFGSLAGNPLLKISTPTPRPFWPKVTEIRSTSPC